MSFTRFRGEARRRDFGKMALGGALGALLAPRASNPRCMRMRPASAVRSIGRHPERRPVAVSETDWRRICQRRGARGNAHVRRFPGHQEALPGHILQAPKPPIHLAAYTMWRVNWIHPFAGGNGRTSRAVSNLVLCARLGYRLPGTLTVPEQIGRGQRSQRPSHPAPIRDRSWTGGRPRTGASFQSSEPGARQCPR